MSYLLDTMVVSEMAKSRPAMEVIEWLRRHRGAGLFLSVVSIGEIEKGITLVARVNPGRADRLKDWLAGLLTELGESMLPITLPIARRWGRLSGAIGHSNVDLMLGATAIEHDLTLVTRNIRHFTSLGIALVDPYAS